MDIKTPTFEQIVRVLSGTGHDEDLLKYLEINFPMIPKLICSHYVDNLGEELSVIPDDVRTFITNPQYTKILCFILCKKNTTRNELIKEFGRDGVQLADELLEKNIIIDDGVRLSVSSKYVYVPHINDVRQILQNLIATSFNSREANKPDSYNFITIQMKPLNAQKILPIIKDKLNKLYHEIDELSKDVEYEGNDPVYVGLIADSISTINTKTGTAK